MKEESPALYRTWLDGILSNHSRECKYKETPKDAINIGDITPLTEHSPQVGVPVEKSGNTYYILWSTIPPTS